MDTTRLATIHHVVGVLDLTITLARGAAASKEPARAALLIACALYDLRPELRVLRDTARRHLVSG